jgi:hypothetical protein
MTRDRSLDDQMDKDEELLNFDLDDLSLSEELDEDLGAEEEIIELSDLVERGTSEDITRDLKVTQWSAAELQQEEDEEKTVSGKEAELDLSDISLEIDAEPDAEKAADAFFGEDITDADLEGLLQEEEGITLDLTEEESPESEEKLGDEITEADLQALLSESGEQALEEEGEAQSLLEIVSDEETEDMEMERLEETQALDLKPTAEDSLLEEEPADILAREVEELGAAAALEEQAGARVEAEFPEEEEAETAPLSGVAEQRVQVEAAEEQDIFAEKGLAGISEERVEEIIRKVVGEVVERVARETMAEVAERMIGEAIGSLKRHLESSEH